MHWKALAGFGLCVDRVPVVYQQLRYEWGGTREVDDYWWVDFWKVVGPSGLEVVGYRYGPWEWYRGEDG
jgi:hypothetical protein